MTDQTQPRELAAVVRDITGDYPWRSDLAKRVYGALVAMQNRAEEAEAALALAEKDRDFWKLAMETLAERVWAAEKSRVTWLAIKEGRR